MHGADELSCLYKAYFPVINQWSLFSGKLERYFLSYFWHIKDGININMRLCWLMKGLNGRFTSHIAYRIPHVAHRISHTACWVYFLCPCILRECLEETWCVLGSLLSVHQLMFQDIFVPYVQNVWAPRSQLLDARPLRVTDQTVSNE